MANKEDKAHMNSVASLGCIVCSNNGYHDSPAEIHHIGNGTMGKRASNSDVIPLCHLHHRTGNNGVAVHSGRKSFEANFGTEQELLKQVRGML
jgi:hypothetical protein